MIEKALAEGELRLCLLGYGEYCIFLRDLKFDHFTDYELLLRISAAPRFACLRMRRWKRKPVFTFR